jgi:hypothetical protein
VTHDASDEGDEVSLPADSGTLAGDSFVTDTPFKAMANQRARFALSHLDDVSVDVVNLGDLAEGVAERDVEAGAAAGVEDHRRRVVVDLHHNHLPRLADAGVVDYDPRSKTIRTWGDDRVETCLELFEIAKQS